MRKIIKYLVVWMMLVTVVLLSGCTPLSQPFRNAVFLAPGFNATKGAGSEAITILPSIDIRKKPDAEVDLLSDMSETAKTLLQEKGFITRISKTYGGVGKITVEKLKSADPKWISQLGASDSRWVLVMLLEDLKVDTSFTTKAYAVASGYMYDKKTRKTTWHDKITMKETARGLYGAMFLSNSFSVRAVTTKLIASIPKRGPSKVPEEKPEDF